MSTSEAPSSFPGSRNLNPEPHTLNNRHRCETEMSLVKEKAAKALKAATAKAEERLKAAERVRETHDKPWFFCDL